MFGRRPRDTQIDAPTPGRGGGSNTAVAAVVTCGPSLQAVDLARSMAYAVNTASPMARGSRVWGGDPGYGVHRWSQRENNAVPGMMTGAVAPVAHPVNRRLGAQAGPSSQPGYPSTGVVDRPGDMSLALMSLAQTTPGWGM